MAQPYVGEIRMFAGNFAPAGWMFCDGSLLPISENETLFQLIGTTYGGDGQSTFGLPNLQSRVPIHMGTDNGSGVTYQIGEAGGTENVTLTMQQIPVHNHQAVATSDGGTLLSPANGVFAQPSSTQAGTVFYDSAVPGSLTMAPTAVTSLGGNQPHDNMQPYLVVSYIISLFGLFPSPT